jgi:hypothetical protein
MNNSNYQYPTTDYNKILLNISDGVTLSYHNMFRSYRVTFKCSVEQILKCYKYFANDCRLT